MPYNILLVDDDSYFRSEFREFMNEYNIKEAKNGEEALQILKKPHDLDLIILDERMPGMKGTELLKTAKKIAPDIFTIILTGNSSKDVAIEAIRGRATDFIEKPLDQKKLEKIREILLSAPKGEKDKTISGVKGKIERTKYFAQRNYDKKLTLEDVAQEINLSSKYLSRLFKQEVGMSFSDYKLEIRIEKAKELLKNTGDNIEEISYKLGYQNPESFARVFRRFTKITPRQYRDNVLKTKSSQKTQKDKSAEKFKLKKNFSKELKKEKELLEKEKKNIQRIIKKRTSELNKTKEKLKKQGHMASLGQMASVVAHEIRRPLGSIRMACWNIKRKSKDNSIAKNIDSIEQMIEEGERIVNNLLDYSRLKKPEKKSVILVNLLEDIIRSSTESITQKNISIITEFLNLKQKKVKVDPVQIKEVVNNILVNAIQAIPDGKKGKITVSAKINPKNFIIKITDNGTGIRKNDLHQVCAPFFTDKPKGTGLGLSICKEIIHSHNGTLEITSRKNKGTTISFKMPR